MRRYVVTYSVLTVLGTLFCLLTQLPASAGIANWFARWDYNHNGCWSWPEFRAANMYWYAHHPAENRLEERQLHRQYNAIAATHGGCVHPQDVQNLHRW